MSQRNVSLKFVFLALSSLLLLGGMPLVHALPENSPVAQYDSTLTLSGTISYTLDYNNTVDYTNTCVGSGSGTTATSCIRTVDRQIQFDAQFANLSARYALPDDPYTEFNDETLPGNFSISDDSTDDEETHSSGDCGGGESGSTRSYHSDVLWEGDGSGSVEFDVQINSDGSYRIFADFDPSTPINYQYHSAETYTGAGCPPPNIIDQMENDVYTSFTMIPEATVDPNHPSHLTGSLTDMSLIFGIPETLTWDLTVTSDQDVTQTPTPPCNLNIPTPYKQGGKEAPWGSDAYGNPSGNYGTISRYGCALTSSAMMLSQQGVDVDPGTLNTWLRSQSDGYKGAALNWAAVARYAREQGVPLYYHGKVQNSATSDDTLNQSLCQLSLPVVVEVPSPSHPGHSHFVLATGQTTINGTPTWSISDPGYDRTDLTTYPDNTYTSFRVFNHDSAGAMVGGGTDTIQVLVTDPLGRQTGVSADGTPVNDIPGSNYSTESIDDDSDPNGSSTPPERVAEIIDPIDGTYIFQTFGVATGSFTMHFFSYDSDQNPADIEIFNGTTAPGEAQTYVVNYSSVPGAAVGVTRLVVNGAVQLQGRPTAPDARWSVLLHVVVTPQTGDAAVFDHQVTTDENGQFELDGLIPGNYRLWVKGSHTLAASKLLTVVAGANQVDVGTLPEGDADGNNVVNLTDFSILAASFGKQSGDPGFDARADFNGDGIVNLTDFSLLASNFGQSGVS